MNFRCVSRDHTKIMVLNSLSPTKGRAPLWRRLVPLLNLGGLRRRFKGKSYPEATNRLAILDAMTPGSNIKGEC
jgi:hypothetical protein